MYFSFKKTALIAFCGCWIALAFADEKFSAPISAAIDVLPEHLVAKPPGANWPSYNGDYTGRRYSSLAEINVNNVNQLRTQWVFHANNSNRLEVTPVVVNELMLVTVANHALALDARTALALWHYQRPNTEGCIDDAS